MNKGYIDENGKRSFFPYPKEQIDVVISLCKDIVERYQIDPTKVLGHSDVAPGRKVDPGPLFPWHRLYNAGIGAWPDPEDVESFKNVLSDEFDVQAVQEDLARYGYKINTDGELSEQTRNVIIAFQMHFRPTDYSGIIDKETMSILKALLKKYYDNRV